MYHTLHCALLPYNAALQLNPSKCLFLVLFAHSSEYRHTVELNGWHRVGEQCHELGVGVFTKKP